MMVFVSSIIMKNIPRKNFNNQFLPRGFFLLEVAYAAILMFILFAAALYVHSVYSKAFFMLADEYEQALLFDACSQKIAAQLVAPGYVVDAKKTFLNLKDPITHAPIMCAVTHDVTRGVYQVLLSAKDTKGKVLQAEYIFYDGG